MKIFLQTLLPLGLVVVLMLGACSSPRCDDTLFEITDLSMTPRRSVPPSREVLNWSNNEGRPVDELLIRINITRNFLNPRDPNSECLSRFETANKLTNLRLMSTQGFSSGVGQDLFEIAAFTIDQTTYIDKQSFIEGYLNESNFTEYYFVFMQQPELDATHDLQIIADFENGDRIESEPIAVFIGRRPTSED